MNVIVGGSAAGLGWPPWPAAQPPRSQTALLAPPAEATAPRPRRTARRANCGQPLGDGADDAPVAGSTWATIVLPPLLCSNPSGDAPRYPGRSLISVIIGRYYSDALGARQLGAGGESAYSAPGAAPRP